MGKSKGWAWCAGLGLFAVVAVVLAPLAELAQTWMAPPLAMQVVGQGELLAGGDARFRVICVEPTTGAGVPGAAIDLRLEQGGVARAVGHAVSDARGEATVTLAIGPEVSGALSLVARARTGSWLGIREDQLTRSVDAIRRHSVLLTTDRPFYQPGQTMHLRALALARPQLRPMAGSTLTFEVQDAKGNKVFKEETRVSEFGVASARFALADVVNEGEYTVRALAGGEPVERTVTVKPYVLPKFKVEVATDRPYYGPGETVTARIDARYFFGKPVGGTVEAELSTLQAGFTPVARGQAALEADGAARIALPLPAVLAGVESEGGRAAMRVRVKVVDRAGHAQEATRSFTVSRRRLVVEALAEAGALVPHVENVVFAAVSRPDGSPVAGATVHLRQAGARAVTDAAGLAELTVIPAARSLTDTLVVSDGGGEEDHPVNLARSGIPLGAAGPGPEASPSDLLLRTDDGIYRAGDTAHVTVLAAAAGGRVYLDVVRDGQTLATRTLDLERGRASCDLALSPDLTGTLRLVAYRMGPAGPISRSGKLIVVGRADGLSVTIDPDRKSYRPGAPAKIAFQVRDRAGRPVQAALGLDIVDESVFALADFAPGLERTYFAIEAALADPKFQPAGVPGDIPAEALRRWRAEPRTARAEMARLARAMLARFVPAGDHSLVLSSVEQRLEAARLTLANQVLAVVTRLAAIGVPLTLIALWLWIVLCGAGSIEPGSKQEDALAGPAQAGLGVAVLALVAPWLATGTSGALIGLSLVTGGLVWLARSLASREVRSHLPGGARFHGSSLLLLAYGAQLALLLCAWAALDGRRGKTDDLLLGCRLVAPLLALAAFTTQLTPKAARARKVRFRWPRSWMSTLFPLACALGVPLLIAAWLDCRVIDRAGAVARAVQSLEWGWCVIGGLLGWHLVTAAHVFPDWEGRVQEAADSHLLEYLLVCGVVGLVAIAALNATGTSVNGLIQKVASSLSTVGGGYADGAPPAAPAPAAGAPAKAGVRVRSFFPETLYSNPSLVTDEHGRAQLDLTMADSITTWRLSGLASSRTGQLGSFQAPLRAFQEFFVDLDLPVTLTRGDEVTVPVAIYNYLDRPQEVRLELEPATWYALDGPPVRTVKLAAGEVTAERFRVRALAAGSHALTVFALGSARKDAIRRTVEVVPAGKPGTAVVNATLDGTCELSLAVPPDSLDAAERLLVRLYPSAASQAVEGLDGVLREPHGCFEQTTSTTLPNIMVLRYLEQTGPPSPEVQRKAEQYVRLGYQRLVTFEVPGGGFSWFGEKPANVMLTAYGLMEFVQMARVIPIDDTLVPRTRAWLLSRRHPDGHFEGAPGMHCMTDAQGHFALTAFVAWTLAASGASEPELAPSVAFLRERLAAQTDPYALALFLNVLAHYAPRADETARLASHLVQVGERAGWKASGRTMVGSPGEAAAVELRALTAVALMQLNLEPTAARAAIEGLIRAKQPDGMWYTPTATVLALQALLADQTRKPGAAPFHGTVRVQVDGRAAGEISVSAANYDVLQQVDLKPFTHRGAHRVTLTADLSRPQPFAVQLVGSWYQPWAGASAAALQPLVVKHSFDRTQLAVDDHLTARVDLEYRAPASGSMVLLDLGIPPGFAVEPADLNALVERGVVSRFELGRRLVLYLPALAPGQPVSFTYRLRARFPIRARTPASSAYEYYDPAGRVSLAPVELEVR